MSRWFKVVFLVMVLFVVRMAIRLNTGPSEPRPSMMASQLYEAFQTDFDAAMNEYAGEHVTIEGEIVEVVDLPDGFVLYMSDGSYERMVEIYPTKLRNYSRNNFGEGQYAGVTGKVADEQGGDWVTLKHCQIF